MEIRIYAVISVQTAEVARDYNRLSEGFAP